MCFICMINYIGLCGVKEGFGSVGNWGKWVFHVEVQFMHVFLWTTLVTFKRGIVIESPDWSCVRMSLIQKAPFATAIAICSNGTAQN